MRNFKFIIALVLFLSISTMLFSQEEIVEMEKVDTIVAEKDTGIVVMETDDETVRIGEDLFVAVKDTVPGDAVAISSNLYVHGLLQGDAICINGNLIITGTVLGDAVCIGGIAEVGSSVVIKGDLVCIGGKLTRDERAQIDGEIVNISLPFMRPVLKYAFKYIGPNDVVSPKPHLHTFARRIGGFFIYIVKIVALVVFIFLIILFFKGGVDRVSDAIAHHFWKSALAGFIGVILTLPLTLLLIVLIIGIPLVPLLWIAIMAGMLFGFVCITYTLGKIAAEKKGWKDKSPYILALIGLLVIEIITLLGNLVILPGGPFMAVGALIKVIGFIVSYVAWMIGFGGVILTRFGSRTFGNSK